METTEHTKKVTYRFPNIECKHEKKWSFDNNKSKTNTVQHQPAMHFSLGPINCAVFDVQYDVESYTQIIKEPDSHTDIKTNFEMHPGSIIPKMGMSFNYKRGFGAKIVTNDIENIDIIYHFYIK